MTTKQVPRPGSDPGEAENSDASGGQLSAATLPKPANSLAEQLHRRRAAALRLPPLASGWRDPLDELAARR